MRSSPRLARGSQSQNRHGLPLPETSRLIRLESQLDEHSAILVPLRDRVELMYGFVDKLEVRTGRLEQELTMITAALRRLEECYDRLEADQLRDRLATLETRVSALESS